MNAVQKDIEELTKKELAAANEKFPLFSSMHEGYAVILEELQEARDEYENADKVHENMFSCIKGNDTKNAIQSAKALKHFAINGAAELIQVAAMAQKFIDSCESQTEQAALIDTAENEYKFSTSQLKDLINGRVSFIRLDKRSRKFY